MNSFVFSFQVFFALHYDIMSSIYSRMSLLSLITQCFSSLAVCRGCHVACSITMSNVEPLSIIENQLADLDHIPSVVYHSPETVAPYPDLQQ